MDGKTQRAHRRGLIRRLFLDKQPIIQITQPGHIEDGYTEVLKILKTSQLFEFFGNDLFALSHFERISNEQQLIQLTQLPRQFLRRAGKRKSAHQDGIAIDSPPFVIALALDPGGEVLGLNDIMRLIRNVGRVRFSGHFSPPFSIPRPSAS